MSLYLNATTPNGNKVSLRTEQSKVIAKVCTEGGCKEETVLIDYTGEAKEQRAEQTVRNLVQTITNRDLYVGTLAMKKDHKLVIDNSVWPWGLGSNTLVDLSREKLGASSREEKIGLFLNNLWKAGVFSAVEIAKVPINRLDTKFWFLPWSRVEYRPRDARLQG